MENIKIYINLLKANKNLVLTGAPGTGKTFLAKKIARAMRAKIEFVQFHPSYSYSDFVEGLRPINSGEGQIGFERRDGVFKNFCKEAIEHTPHRRLVKVEDKTLFDYYEELSEEIRKGNITQITTRIGKTVYVQTSKKGTINATPKAGTSKKTSNKQTTNGTSTYSMSFQKIQELAERCPDIDSLNNLELSSGRESARVALLGSIYKMKEDEIQAEAESGKNIKPLNLEYEQEDDSLSISPKSYVFIIDEINRGELSKIFGELFYAIDPGYRGRKGKVKTQYQNLIDKKDFFSGGFYVPENVYILATMNDIDRSVENIDFALRRRFAWKEIKPKDRLEMLSGKLDHDTYEKVIRVMEALNTAISNTRGLGSAYQLGPAYFLKLDKDHYNGDFTMLWDMHIEILLKEYLRAYSNAEAKIIEFKKIYFDSLD